MTCDQWQSRVSLYLYGELRAEENDALEDHLENCGDCTRVLEEERDFFALLDTRKPGEAAGSLLAECRHDLMRNVYRCEPVRTGVWGWWDGVQRSLAGARLVWQPTAALVLAALAFYAGRATQTRPAENFPWSMEPTVQQGSLSLADTPLTGIESVAIDPREGREGRVQIVVEEVSRRTISGSSQDPHIRQLLLSTKRTALNAGVRLDMLDVLTQQTEDVDVRRFLVDSMKEDSNAGVRFKALDALKAHKQDPEVRQALMEVLRRDGNPGMRVQAIELLTETPDRDLVGVLQELVETEANQYVRLRSEQTLQELNASVDRF